MEMDTQNRVSWTAEKDINEILNQVRLHIKAFVSTLTFTIGEIGSVGDFKLKNDSI